MGPCAKMSNDCRSPVASILIPHQSLRCQILIRPCASTAMRTNRQLNNKKAVEAEVSGEHARFHCRVLPDPLAS
jgi:hypothetical protein